jgi:hypothetical protein
MYEKIMSTYQMTKTFSFTIVSNKPLFGSLFLSPVVFYFTPELIIIVAVMLPLQLHCRYWNCHDLALTSELQPMARSADNMSASACLTPYSHPCKENTSPMCSWISRLTSKFEMALVNTVCLEHKISWPLQFSQFPNICWRILTLLHAGRSIRRTASRSTVMPWFFFVSLT